MNNKMDTTKKIEVAQPIQPKDMLVVEPGMVSPFDPEQDTARAKRAADVLADIVKQNRWAKAFRPGQKEHLFYEAWQTIGKYYNLSVDTDYRDPEFVEYGGVWGFRAHAQVIDTATGRRVGGASALCMSDEPNWNHKPRFQLESMAQTRAGSKALRQLLGFVVALAGYNPTPADEMEGVHDVSQPLTPRQMATQLEDRPAAQETEATCETCGARAFERKGISKQGKPYHGVFCSSDDKSHTRWLFASEPFKQPSASPQEPPRRVEGKESDNVTDVPEKTAQDTLGLLETVSKHDDVPTVDASRPAAAITTSQKSEVIALLPKKGKTFSDLTNALKIFKVDVLKDLSARDADKLLIKLRSLPDANAAEEAFVDDVAAGMEQAGI